METGPPLNLTAWPRIAAIAWAFNVAVSAIALGDDARVPEKPPVAAFEPYCGVYSLFGAAKLLGVTIDFPTLIHPKYISGDEGSTLLDLETAAREHGLGAKAITRGTLTFLRHTPAPVILHWRTKLDSKSYNHYVLYAGTRNGRPIILDEPQSAEPIDWGEVQIHWDGAMLLLARTNHEIPSNLALLARSIGPYHALAALGVAAAWLLKFLRDKTDRGTRHHSQSLARTAVQSGLVLVLAISLAVADQSLRPDGFLGSPSLARELQNANAHLFLPEVDRTYVKNSIDHGTILIDARWKVDFDAGHIANAKSIEPNATDQMCLDALTGVQRSKSIVIYCQSASCPYSGVIARRLYALGFTNIAIYKQGYIDWISSS